MNPQNKIFKIFNVKDPRAEFIGGMTTFFTMVYIVVVNPSILASPGTGMSFSGVLTATVLLCFSMTLLMGLYARLPFAVGPGMGVNAFFTYTVVISSGVPWPTALGAVFIAGLLFLIISLTGLRVALARAIPENLRIGSAVGIGFFLTFIGFKNMGLVVADPTTFVKLGHLTPTTVLSLVGLLVMLFGLHKKSPFAFLIGIFSVTAIGFLIGEVKPPQEFFSAPDFNSVFLKLDILGALKLSLLPTVFSILMTDLFDSISTFVGVAHATGFKDENGDPKNLREGLIVDAWATLTAGLFGTSSGTAYLESAAGIEAGARTGFSSIITALCFLPCFFIAPVAEMVPSFATAPVLIVIGGLMFRAAKDLPVSRMEDLIPAFLTVILIPLTFSITQGLLWGFISHVILYVLTGRRREIPAVLYGIALLSGLLIAESSFGH